jgi:phosphoribosyl-ATP pyrophosphohydrolase
MMELRLSCGFRRQTPFSSATAATPLPSTAKSAITPIMTAFSLTDLETIVRARAAAPASESYTAKLLAGGPHLAAKKLGEEAVEAVMAAVAGHKDELRKEAADVLYHLLVVLRGADVPLSAVMAELETRTRRSGLAEKASRKVD